MKFSAVIIDDEHLAIRTLTILLGDYFENIDIVGTAIGVEDGINLIQEKNPDIVFLDIEMPTGSGFEVVERTQHLSYKLVFTTAYNSYAIKAFKANAIDYLLKPIDVEELQQTVRKIEKQHVTETSLSLKDISALFQSQVGEKVSIPTKEGYELLEKDAIIRLESDSNYSWIYLKGKNKMLVSKTLKEMQSNLENKGFLRVHNSHLINKKHVEKYIKSDGGYLVLSDGAMVPISKSKKQEIIEEFGF